MVTRERAPYTVSVRDLVGRPGQMRELDIEVAVPERLGEGLVYVEAGAGLDIGLRLESVHEGILATAEVTGTAEGICGRCLTDIELPVRVDFQELFAYPSEEASDYEVHDDHVDLEPLVRDAVVLSLPFQPVCRQDCPGLDPETGERLSEAPTPDPSAAIDPRWAALAEFRASDPDGPDVAVAEDQSDREER